MLVRTHDPMLAHRKLRVEIEHAPADVQKAVPIPGEGAVETSMLAGDVFLIDPADDRREDRGTVVWVHAEPNWKAPGQLAVMHAWGESRKHYDILKELMEWLIAEGLGDLPIDYERSGHPMTVVADTYFATADQIDSTGRKVTTTARRAKTIEETKRPPDRRVAGGGR